MFNFNRFEVTALASLLYITYNMTRITLFALFVFSPFGVGIGFAEPLCSQEVLNSLSVHEKADCTKHIQIQKVQNEFLNEQQDHYVLSGKQNGLLIFQETITENITIQEVLFSTNENDQKDFNQICRVLLGDSFVFTSTPPTIYTNLSTAPDPKLQYRSFLPINYQNEKENFETRLLQHLIIKSISCKKSTIQTPNNISTIEDNLNEKMTMPNIVSSSWSALSLWPKNGPTSGGTLITIKGDGFIEGMKVLIDNQHCTKIKVINENEVQCITPKHNQGSYPVTLTHEELESLKLEEKFIYKPWGPFNQKPAPSARNDHTAIWNGSEMIVWGGYNGSVNLNDGYTYNLTTNTWKKIFSQKKPSARSDHSAIWNGSEMIVWGGSNMTSQLNDGYAYSPTTDTWKKISSKGAPSSRSEHTAIWDGSEMIIWGGWNGSAYLKNGYAYNPTTDTWKKISSKGAPSSRSEHSAIWDGSEMIIWGGSNMTKRLNDGYAYNPTTDTWRKLSSPKSPSARSGHTAIWNGSEMIVWGGWNGYFEFNDGYSYNPTTDTWGKITSKGAPSSRSLQTAIWNGSEMIIWGGWSRSAPTFNGGGVYFGE